jgi:hypothetical protein
MSEQKQSDEQRQEFDSSEETENMLDRHEEEEIIELQEIIEEDVEEESPLAEGFSDLESFDLESEPDLDDLEDIEIGALEDLDIGEDPLEGFFQEEKPAEAEEVLGGEDPFSLDDFGEKAPEEEVDLEKEVLEGLLKDAEKSHEASWGDQKGEISEQPVEFDEGLPQDFFADDMEGGLLEEVSQDPLSTSQMDDEDSLDEGGVRDDSLEDLFDAEGEQPSSTEEAAERSDVGLSPTVQAERDRFTMFPEELDSSIFVREPSDFGPVMRGPSIDEVIDQLEERLAETLKGMVESRLPDIVRTILQEEIEKLKNSFEKDD